MPYTEALEVDVDVNGGAEETRRLRRATHRATGPPSSSSTPCITRTEKKAAATSRHVCLASRSPERIMDVHDNFVYAPRFSLVGGNHEPHAG
jgi:hypothetical protein